MATNEKTDIQYKIELEVTSGRGFNQKEKVGMAFVQDRYVPTTADVKPVDRNPTNEDYLKIVANACGEETPRVLELMAEKDGKSLKGTEMSAFYRNQDLEMRTNPVARLIVQGKDLYRRVKTRYL